MTYIIPEPRCECCDSKDVYGVIASSYGPMSFGTCKPCFLRSAEPTWVADYLLGQAPFADLTPHAQRCTIYKDGAYISIEHYVPDADVMLAKDYDELDTNLGFLNTPRTAEESSKLFASIFGVNHV